MTKAILLDSMNKEIRKVELEEGIENIYKFLGENVRCFDVVQLDENVTMFVDDEALLKEAYIDDEGIKHNMTGIKIRNFPQVIIGNGLIVGDNKEGETIDCPINKAQVETIISFVEYDNPNDRPQPFMDFVSF